MASTISITNEIEKSIRPDSVWMRRKELQTEKKSRRWEDAETKRKLSVGILRTVQQESNVQQTTKYAFKIERYIGTKSIEK